MEELLCKLESLDMEESRKSVTRLQSMLRAERNPVFLGELVEFYFATRSKRAVKVLTSLREAYSQVRPRSGTWTHKDFRAFCLVQGTAFTL